MFGLPKVKDIKQVEKKPAVIKTNDKELNLRLQQMLPDKYYPVEMSFMIDNVSHAVSNAIRRTLSCEIPVKSLVADIQNWKTTDAFPNGVTEMVLKRIRMIPIDQKTPIASTYKLVASNDTTSVRDVKSGEFITVNGPKNPFNSNYTICTLQPGKTITISDIYVQETLTYIENNGMNSGTSGCVSLADDVKPIEWYDDNLEKVIAGEYTTGLPSSISNPRRWVIKFLTNGTINPNKLVVDVCDNLIERVKRIETLLDTIININNEYILLIEGESHTIGNLFMRTISDMYEDIPFVVYTSDNFRRAVTIRLKTSEDADTIFKKVIKYLVTTFEAIGKEF